MSQVILFDLDGTLTDPFEGITKSVQYALSKMGVVEENLDNLKKYIGPPLKDSFMEFAGMTEDEAVQAIAYYRERFRDTGIFENKLYPKVPDLLELLQINDKIMGVASSKPEVFVKQILEHFEIASYFRVVVGSELDGTRNKKSEVIEEALNRLGMQTQRDKVIMVGDREHDVYGAISCGIQCVGAAYGYGSQEELEQVGAVYIAETVEDLAILASPNDEETTEHVESIRNIQMEPVVDETQPLREELAENIQAISEEDIPVVQKEMSTIRHIWRSIYPILIHYGISILSTVVAMVYFMAVSFDSFYEKTLETSLYQLIVTSILAGGITLLIYRSDQKKRKEGYLGKRADFVWCPPVIWFSVVVLAVDGCQILNDLIILFRLNEIFPGYSQLAELTMEGQPMWLLLLTVGILAPITEELVFRGLVFRRMKDWMKPTMAIVLSAVFFGLYHGNFVQFLYAALLGMLLALMYHRTGTLWTAIVAHMAANLWSLFGYEWWSQMMHHNMATFVLGIVLELLLCIIPGYWIFFDRKKLARSINKAEKSLKKRQKKEKKNL